MTELVDATFVDASWRVYPATMIIVAGTVFAVRSVARCRSRAIGLRDPWRALELMRGFRLSVIGLSIASFGAAWLWSIGWLAVLAAIIGGEELLESSVAIAAIRNGPEGAR